MSLNKQLPPAVRGVGDLIEDVPVVVGLNAVPHPLGRAPVGHFVCYSPNRPAFVRAFKAGNQNVPKNTITTVEIDAISNAYAADYDILTSSLVAPHQGMYHLAASAGLDNLKTNIYSSAWISGSSYGTIAAESGNKGGGSTNDVRRSMSADVLLQAGEFITLMVYHSNNGNRKIINGNDDTWLSMRSIEDVSVASADAANLQVYSSRVGTVSVWVW